MVGTNALEPWKTWVETNLVDVSDFWTVEVETLWLSVEVVWPLEALVGFALVNP